MHDQVQQLGGSFFSFIYFNRKALLRDGAAVDADDFAAFEEWLFSLSEQQEEQQEAIEIE